MCNEGCSVRWDCMNLQADIDLHMLNYVQSYFNSDILIIIAVGINESLNQARFDMTNETHSDMYMNNKTTDGTSLPAVEFWK